MSLEDLLYHLQHPESLHQLTVQEINQLLIKYPYLESLKLLYEKKLNGHNAAIQSMDIHHRLELAGKQAMNGETEYAYQPPVFDLPVAETPPEEVVQTSLPETIHQPEIREETELIPAKKFQLYPYEESEFIRYLNTLPSSKTESMFSTGTIKVQPVELQITEKLISDSIDFQPSFGTESLADLWATQGKTLEAIGVYEKLALEYPDKKTIFAAKIEKLKAEDSL